MGRLYRKIFDIAFAPMDPELAHHLVYHGLAIAGHIPVLRTVLQRGLAPYSFRHLDALDAAEIGNIPGAVEVLGQQFTAPFGLAAGFDKDAGAVRGLAMLGFSFIEVGTITPLAQPGNDKPRLWRDVDNDALRNAMGFNNEGAEAAAKKLAHLRKTHSGRAIKVAVNIGKNKVTSPADAPTDYATAAYELAPYADFLVVNVSSPNTPGLRDLQSVDSLREILMAARTAADEATAVAGNYAGVHHVPLLVKIAPDLANVDILAIADLVIELGIDGVVAVNTTINHDLGIGGVSGPALKPRGLEVVKLLRSVLPADKAIIGCGGIATAADAEEYLAAGANLVQGYTGFIYHGPLWPSKINRALTN